MASKSVLSSIKEYMGAAKSMATPFASVPYSAKKGAKAAKAKIKKARKK